MSCARDNINETLFSLYRQCQQQGSVPVLYSGTVWRGDASPARAAAEEQTLELLFRSGCSVDPFRHEPSNPCGSFPTFLIFLFVSDSHRRLWAVLDMGRTKEIYHGNLGTSVRQNWRNDISDTKLIQMNSFGISDVMFKYGPTGFPKSPRSSRGSSNFVYTVHNPPYQI